MTKCGHVILRPGAGSELRRSLPLFDFAKTASDRRIRDDFVNRREHHLVPRRVLRVEQMLRLLRHKLPDGTLAAANRVVIERRVRLVAFRQLEGDDALREQIAEAMHESVCG